MTNLDEIKARRERINGASWKAVGGNSNDIRSSVFAGNDLLATLSTWKRHEYADFIANAPTDIDRLIAEVEMLSAEKAQAEAERDALITTLINRDEHPRINCCGNPDCYNCWVKYAQQQVAKKQNHVAFLRAELATVNDILATLSEKDVMGRMSFEGKKIEIEAEIQQAETEGVKHGRSFF